jgi:hypothetical protein
MSRCHFNSVSVVMPSTVAGSSIPWIDPIMRPAFAISSSGQSTWTDREVSPGDNLPAAAPSLLSPTRPGVQSTIEQLMGGNEKALFRARPHLCQ